MAIIYRHSRATNDLTGKPMECPACGTQMHNWSSEKHGGSKTECFSMNCAKPIPIGMIMGDVHDFYMKEYGIPGTPEIVYPKAEGYSAELREAVRKYLMAWGFAKVDFIEPDPENEKSERHTVITGVHISPTVNIAFRKAPRTSRVFIFQNKFGVVSTKFRFHEYGERSYWKWHDAADAVQDYNKALGNKTVHENEKAIILPGRENLRQKAADEILKAQKDVYLSQIRDNLYEISDYNRKIKDCREEIASLKATYEKKFGEPAPKQKSEV